MTTTNKKQSPDQILMGIINGYTLYKDNCNKAYAEVTTSVGKKNFIEIQSQEFTNQLSNDFTVITGRFAPFNIKQAVQFASNQALEKGKEVDVCLRFGTLGNTIYIDMNNDKGEYIRISATGWDIVKNTPIKFRRVASQQPLVQPTKNGDIKLILKYLNLKDEQQEILLLSTLCMLPFVDIVRPILGFIGPAGSAKTTHARMFRNVFDPNNPLVNTPRVAQDDISLVFYHNAIPLLDNMSKIPKWMSDILCRAITGDGYDKRTLYTDAGLFTMAYKRPLIITAVKTPSEESDFLDRFIPIKLDKIQPGNRKEEIPLWSEYKNDLPSILGGCLDTIVQAKKIHPTINLSQLPRLADYARWGAAISEVLGYGKDRFIEGLFDVLKRQNLDTIADKEPVLWAVVKYIEKHDELKGSSTEVLKKLKSFPFPGNQGLPNGASGIGRILERLIIEGSFDDFGISVLKSRNKHGSHYEICKIKKEEILPLQETEVDVLTEFHQEDKEEPSLEFLCSLAHENAKLFNQTIPSEEPICDNANTERYVHDGLIPIVCSECKLYNENYREFEMLEDDYCMKPFAFEGEDNCCLSFYPKEMYMDKYIEKVRILHQELESKISTEERLEAEEEIPINEIL